MCPNKYSYRRLSLSREELFLKEDWEYIHLEAANGLVDPGDDGGVVGGGVEQVPDEHVEGRQWHLIGACVRSGLHIMFSSSMHVLFRSSMKIEINILRTGAP